MFTTGRRILGGLAAGVLAAALATAPARAADASWQRVAAPPAVPQAGLNAVAARTGDDIWAVGHEAGAAGTPAQGRPLILHFDGRTWRRTPVAGATWTGDLRSVAASGARQAWATGTDTGGAFHLLRWDGARWAEAPYPGEDAGVTAYKVFAGPGGETWLLTGGTPGYGLLRRAGGTWQSVPNPPSASGVSGLRIYGPDRVWAAGSTSAGQFGDSYAARWDGTRWHELPAYDGGFYEAFVDVAAPSDDDVWAVGNGRGIGTVAPVVPVLAHWDGTAWTKTPISWIPSPSGINVGSVTSLAVDDSGNPAWIGIGDTYGTPPDAATYARFENGTWVEHYGPADGWTSNPRMYVTHAPGTSAYWSVGSARDAAGDLEPRIERTG